MIYVYPLVDSIHFVGIVDTTMGIGKFKELKKKLIHMINLLKHGIKHEIRIIRSKSTNLHIYFGCAIVELQYITLDTSRLLPIELAR